MKKPIRILLPLALVLVTVLIIWWFWPRRIEDYVNKEDIESVEIKLIVSPEDRAYIFDGKDVEAFFEKMNSYTFHKAYSRGLDGTSFAVIFHLNDGDYHEIRFASEMKIDEARYSLNKDLEDAIWDEFEKRTGDPMTVSGS